MRARPASEEALQSRVDGDQERLRDARRRCHADGIAVAGNVLDRDPARDPGDADANRAAPALQVAQPRLRDARAAFDARGDLVGREVAQATQQVVDLIDGGRQPLVGQ
jgi:hypothetical protein